MTEITLGMKLVLEHCCACHIAHAMPAEFAAARRQDHKTFYCPAGHSQVYGGESEVEKANRLRAQAERSLQVQVNEAQHAKLVAERERDKAVKDKRRIERRISKGVCGCCNRTFEDLAKHMASKHKDFVKKLAAPPKQILGAA